ncbi:HAD hydrolase-like protein [Lentzea nigeriaca]|uniref:HAD hydrolase-like protein n=1 Tax=Lentzea nigeriaca TaxID=1128665 RepID=UPI00195F1E57|nr:HAD hydrolase-like protein [Lentzea nigeriaca]MBM7857452.1 ribonucleotide monophosphatase NagD (HAD superfamily) [Lentzea nigeriaca]
MGKPPWSACNALRTAPGDLAVVGDDPELEMAIARRADVLAIAVATGIHPADHYTALPPKQKPISPSPASADSSISR